MPAALDSTAMPVGDGNLLAPARPAISAAPTPVPRLKPSPATTPQAVHSSLELLGDLYNYTHWLFNRVRPFIRGRVCEVGCGIGTVTQYLLNCDLVVGIEPFEESFLHARHRFRNHLNVRIVNCFLEQCPTAEVPAAGFDTVVCLNVLEHLEDDLAALTGMARLCAPRGRVIILVPAHPCIYGQLDRSYGHYRRYNRRSLGRVFAAARLQVTYSSYMNSLGFFGWWSQSCLRKLDQLTHDSSRLFNRMVPFLDAFERIVRLPFGQSLIMVGTNAAAGV